MSDLQRLQSSATVVPIESRRGRKWQALALIGVCMLLLASAVLAWRLRRWAHSAPISSLAVLPLQNLSHDSGQDYFSLGMTDELTNELASLHSLKVISRTSAAHFAGSSLSSPEIGQRLGVDALIEGSVLRSGDRVRITLDLIDAASDRHLWSKSYDRPAANVIAVQQEVAHAVAEEIHLALSPEDTRRLNRPLTTNAEAYEAFLRAQYHLQTALGHEQDVEKALAEAEHAVQLDPSFARAYVAVAQACIAKMFGFNGGPEFDERAVVALERARTLDPSLAEVYAIRGGLAYTKYHNFDIVAAIADYKRALALNPNLADAHQRLVSEFSHFGLHQQAIEELQKTLQLDPENQPAIVRIGRPLWQSNQFAEALRQYEMHNVKTWETAVVLMYLGRTSEAWARLDEIDGPNRSRAVREKLERGNISPSEADVLAVRGLLYAHEGKRQQAEPLLARAAQLGVGYDHFHHAAIIIAAAYAEMGKAPESVKWLRYAADNGMPNYPLFRDNPSLKKLLGTPDYDRFLSELQPRWEEMKRQIETPVSQ